MTIDEVTAQYNINLQKAAAITGLGEQIIDISMSALNGILKSAGENTTKQKISNHIKSLSNLYSSPVLSELIPTISGQQVVLTVSSFEVYMSDLVRCIGNEYRSQIRWPDDGKSGKIELSLLNSDVATIGDLVLGIVEQQNISFQDLQSTKRFLNEYMQIDFGMTIAEEEHIILATALRHSIVHAGGVADVKFMRQIRNTSHASSYSQGQNIIVSNNDAKNYMQTFRKAGRSISTKLKTKLGVDV